MKHFSLLSLSALILLTACNGGGGGGKSKPKAEEQEPIPQEVVIPDPKPDIDTTVQPDVEIDDPNVDVDAPVKGEYLAVFKMVNPDIAKDISGAFTFSRKVEKDTVAVDIRLRNVAEVIHAQHVRVGTRCPGPQDDKNADGFIDALEGEKVYGKIFFPLDYDLSSQKAKEFYFPLGQMYGYYEYNVAAKFSEFIADLRAYDRPNGYYKLQNREKMNLVGRVVVVMGVAENTNFPVTVASTSTLLPHQSLPIVCGVIEKVGERPTEIDDGTYPVEPEILE